MDACPPPLRHGWMDRSSAVAVSSADVDGGVGPGASPRVTSDEKTAVFRPGWRAGVSSSRRRGPSRAVRGVYYGCCTTARLMDDPRPSASVYPRTLPFSRATVRPVWQTGDVPPVVNALLGLSIPALRKACPFLISRVAKSVRWISLFTTPTALYPFFFISFTAFFSSFRNPNETILELQRDKKS